MASSQKGTLGSGASACSRVGLLIAIVGALMACQLIACSQLATAGAGNGGDAKPAANAPAGLPVLFVRQEVARASSAKQDEGSKKPDIFLLWLKPYESFIPSQIMDQIDSSVRPQTEQVTNQWLSQVPGAEEFYSQLSGFMNQISNMGGAQSLLSNLGGGRGGGNPLSNIMEQLGNGRRR